MTTPIRILLCNGGLMNRGGIESYMMNYYRHIDRIKIQFDFLVHNAGGFGYYDDEIKKLGGRIYILPQKSKHPFRYNKELKTILQSTDYKIIHTHMDAMGTWVLRTAKQCGIPVRIAHSHNTQHLSNNPVKLLFLKYAQKHITKYATHCMACSEMAGKWLFGDKPFTVIHNAIDIDKFSFNQTIRDQVRKEWKVENNFVIGHVGRFDTQKNHLFLLDIFAEIHQQLPQTKLMLLGGGGHLGDNIAARINDLQIQDAVILTGVRDDVYRFYNAFDLFVLPSLFEGLGIVAIEAEINGCTALLSNQVPIEAKITENVDFIPLEKKLWVEKMIQVIKNNRQHTANVNHEATSEYDILQESVKLQNMYLDLYKNNYN